MTFTSARLPFTICNQSLTFFVKGKPYSLTREHERFEEARKLLQAPGDHDAEHLMALVDVRKALLRDSFGAITFIGQDIVFKGQVLTGLWVDRILEFQRAGEPFAPLWNALGSLMQNPTQAAIERLPVFLDKSQLGFLEDGRFVAYKAVNQDYMDCHTGRTFRNMIGDKPAMDRDKVDANPNACCSTGLHVGTPDYVKSHYGSDAHRVMLIAVWPHDVVSVPFSYQGTKMRICAYEVIDELDEDYAATILGRPVLTPRSQLPAPNDAALDEVDQDQGVEEEQQSEDLTEDDSVTHQPGTVVEYVEFDATLYGVVGDADLVRGLDGHVIEPDRIVRVLGASEITAAVVACEGAEIRVEGDPAIKDGDYTINGYSDDDEHTQLDGNHWFWRVDLRDVDGGVAVMNHSIKTVTVRGEQLWPRTAATEITFPNEGGVELKSLDGHDLRGEAEALVEQPALLAQVGDLVETIEGGWPPAGIYPVVRVDEGCNYRLILQTEHDGEQGVLNSYVKRIVPADEV